VTSADVRLSVGPEIRCRRTICLLERAGLFHRSFEHVVRCRPSLPRSRLRDRRKQIEVAKTLFSESDGQQRRFVFVYSATAAVAKLPAATIVSLDGSMYFRRAAAA
jgi:hypothetical protein